MFSGKEKKLYYYATAVKGGGALRYTTGVTDTPFGRMVDGCGDLFTRHSQ